MSSASKVNGEMKPRRMEFRHFAGPTKGCMLPGQAGEYYSVDGYQLCNWDTGGDRRRGLGRGLPGDAQLL
jgi:hypothetical protein